MLPPLRIELRLGGVEANQHASVATEVTARVGAVLARLGIEREVQAEVSGHSEGRPILTVDGARMRYAPFRLTRARMSSERRQLEPTAITADGGVRDGEGRNPVREAAALVELVVIRDPAILIDETCVHQLRSQIDPTVDPVGGEILEAAVRRMVACGIGLGDLSAVRTAWADLRERSFGHAHLDVAEEIVARVHPRELGIQLATGDFTTVLTTDPTADREPFAPIHRYAPMPLPSLGIRPSPHVPDGCYRVRINDLYTVPQPLLPSGMALRLDQGAGRAVHLPGWGRAACLIESREADPQVVWFGLQHLCVEVLGLMRVLCPRLLDCVTVDDWCSQLGRSSLVAAFRTRSNRAALTRVMRALLREQVPVFDVPTILQRLIDHAAVETPPPRLHFVLTHDLPIDDQSGLPAPEDRMVEHVRAALGRVIYDTYAVEGADGERVLSVFVLTIDVENRLAGHPSESWQGWLVHRLIAALDGHQNVAVVVSVEVRAVLSRLLEPELPTTPVMAYQELPASARLSVLGEIGLDDGEHAPAEAAVIAAPEPQQALGLFLARRDGEVIAPAGFGASVLAAIGDPPAMRDLYRRDEFAGDAAAPPDDLRRQGWGLIVPEGERGRLLEAALEELVAHRVSAQGASHWIRRIPATMDDAAVHAWVAGQYEAIPEPDRPRYLLIVGDFDEVPLELQLVLASQAYVGRLALDDVEEPDYEAYQRYAAKAVRAEGHLLESLATHVFAARDGQLATRFGELRLAKPTFEDLVNDTARNSHLQPPRWLSGKKAEFLDEVRAPGLLFTVSHGVGDAMSYPERRALQGALVLGRDELLTGADVASGVFLKHGVWFMTACYGAGTPRASTYDRLIRDLGDAAGVDRPVIDAIRDGQLVDGQRPFAAALPRAALGNPQGPLAVIGHADLAWSHSFLDGLAGRHHRLLSALRVLLAGYMVGYAHEQIMRSCAAAATRLLHLIRRRDAGEHHVARGELLEAWILCEDLRGYIVLGDPAARLRVVPKD